MLVERTRWIFASSALQPVPNWRKHGRGRSTVLCRRHGRTSRS